MKARFFAAVLLTLALPVVAFAQAGSSDPSIQGAVQGVEICPQSICGAATFVGVYSGKVGNKPAFGLWLLAVRHGEYSPPEQILPPPGESVDIIGGTWHMKVFVLDWFWYRKKLFGGAVQPGTLVQQGDPGDDPPPLLYDVNSALILQHGGTGIVRLENTVLNENTFPPTISGLLR